MPLFSIIMPVYNNERYFPLAVESIICQEFKDIELIIVDDGSTDNTSYIADKFAKRDKRIRVIHQENKWIYESFNNGIKEAVGDYIYIVNSDDRLRASALVLLAQKVKEYHPDVIWTKVLAHICDEKQNILVYDSAQLDKKVLFSKFCGNRTEVHNNWPFLIESFLAQNHANLYKREIMLKHPFRNNIYGADYLFNISIAEDIKKALILKEPIYDFFEYQQSNMNVSVGKYYSYEHTMFNEMYIQYKNLFERWGLLPETYQNILVNKRLAGLSRELRSLLLENCSLSTEEKLRRIYLEYMDEILYQCALDSDRVEELESRILSGTRELLVREAISEDNEMYFVYELIESLLCYEKDETDYRRIEYAVNHPLNPAHIGKLFYEKLIT